MDGLRMMEWSERMWGMTPQNIQEDARNVLVDMQSDSLLTQAFGTEDFANLVLGLALIGVRHCHVPRSPMHEPSLC